MLLLHLKQIVFCVCKLTYLYCHANLCFLSVLMHEVYGLTQFGLHTIYMDLRMKKVV